MIYPIRLKLAKYDPIALFGKTLAFAFFSLLFLTANFTSFAQSPGSVDPTFTGGVTRDARVPAAIIVQPDGKHLIASSNNAVNGRGRNIIARLNADGTLDESFVTDSRYEGSPLAMALQPDGKILIGGALSFQLNPNGVNNKRNIARLNSDGTLDTAFSTGGGADGSVSTIALQPDGRIIIGGSFSNVDGTARRGVARLNADGSLDMTFNSAATAATVTAVNAVALQTDGKIIVGGQFTAFGTARINIARLNFDGSLDTTFNVGTGANQSVSAIAVQTDGKVIIGGNFTQYNSVTAQYIARLNTDGSRDTSFVEGSSSFNINGAQQITVLSDGRIYISNRGFANPTPGVGGLVNTIVRFNANGSRDTTFALPLTPPTIGISFLEPSRHAVQADGKIVTNLPRQIPVSIPLGLGTYITRYNADGSPDTAYAPILQTPGSIYNVAIQPDGKVIAVGDFLVANTAFRLGLARFNTDGTLDTAFNTVAESLANQVALQPDGKIIIAGDFIRVNGVNRGHIARLNSDGTLDTSFTTNGGADGGIYALKLQTDGKVLIGGSFSNYNSTARRYIARLNADGSLDTTFNPGTGFAGSSVRGVEAIDVQSNGKIIVGGTFVNFNGTSRNNIARLNADGTLDTTFNPGTGPEQVVSAVKVSANGKILIAGGFFTYNNVSRRGIARLNADGSLDTAFGDIAQLTGNISEIYVQTNGKIIIAGEFISVAGQVKRGVARLTANGTLDNSFGANMEGALPSPVFARNDVGLAVDETSGRLYFGSNFSTFNNVGRASLVRLFTGNTQTGNTLFDFDGDGKADVSVFRPSNNTWYLQQSQAGFASQQFGLNGDVIAPADYDADGKTDIAVFRAGIWYLQRSSLGFTGIQFGADGDVPVPADFDADGKADLAVFRPSNGIWYIQQSTAGFTGIQFGAGGDAPLAADYDGDGKADVAVFRPSNSTWYLQRSQAGFTAVQFGATGDKPVPADFDADGKTDLAVFRPSASVWYLQRSSLGFTGVQFGSGSDLPTPADYDGDGRADLAVFRPSNGVWYIQQSTAGFTGIQFGAAGDKPAPTAYVP